MSLRIVLAGPESSGKTDLTEHLARTFGLPYAPEYARIYLERNGPEYDEALLWRMSCEHQAHQAACVPDEAAVGLLDTDLINYKIWSEVVFGRCHPDLIRNMESETRHTYLLCYPDLPWVYDPLRANPDDRPMLFERHVREIEALKRTYCVIRGTGDDRRRAAESAVRSLLAVQR